MDVTRAVVRAVQLSATASAAPLKATARIARGAFAVSEVRPRVGVHFVDPKTSMSYVLPVADISYILMDVAAYVDVRGLNPIVRDITPVIDLNEIMIGKGLIDPVNITDEILLQWGRELYDVAVATESIDILIEILRTFLDTYQVEDASTIGFGLNKNEVILTSELFSLIYEKGLADATSPIDVTAKGISRVSQDSQSSIDSNAIGFNKNAQDSVEATQDFELRMHFRRVENEFVSQPDLSSFNFLKSSQDFVLNSDVARSTISKILVDAFTAAENAIIEMQYNKLASDSANATDVRSSNYGKAASEIASVLDSLSAAVDFNLPLSDSQNTADAFSRIVYWVRQFDEVVSLSQTDGKLNNVTFNVTCLNDTLGGDRVSIVVGLGPPPPQRNWLYILDDYEEYSFLARKSPVFAMNILYGS